MTFEACDLMNCLTSTIHFQFRWRILSTVLETGRGFAGYQDQQPQYGYKAIDQPNGGVDTSRGDGVCPNAA